MRSSSESFFFFAVLVTVFACGGGSPKMIPPSCVAGGSCTPASACHTGVVTCGASGAVCTEAAASPDGTSCGGTNVCSAGACVPPCVAGGSCTPASACHTGVVTCGASGAVCTEAAASPDGTSCGGTNVCSAGACVPPCVAGGSCTPASACHTGVVTCGASGAVCTEAAVVPDGASCGGTNLCNAGACVDRSTTRTLGGTFKTLYRPDDGTTTTVGETRRELEVATAVLVPDQSAQGYARFPITVAMDGTFSVQNAPVGSWYLEFDQVSTSPDLSRPPQIVNAKNTRLLPMYSSQPDLSSVLAARPDLARATNATPVATTIDGLLPSTGNAALFVVGSQIDTYGFLPIPRNSTSYSASLDWATLASTRAAGLPQAAKNDSVVWYERGHEPWTTPAGSGTLRRAVKFARTTDLTLTDGQAATASATLAAAPQTGAFDLDLKTSAFAALAGDVGPQGQLLEALLDVSAAPHAVAYPDLPGDSFSLLLADVPTTADVHLTAPYGQFLGAAWQEMKIVQLLYQVSIANTQVNASILFYRAAADLPGTLAGPVISPPTSLQVNGQSAGAPVRGASLQPTISWSAPRVGTATSYLVTIQPVSGVAAAGDTASLSILVDGARSIRVPPGFLKSGNDYYAIVAAQTAPWDGPGRLPLRNGTPRSYAEAVTADFSP